MEKGAESTETGKDLAGEFREEIMNIVKAEAGEGKTADFAGIIFRPEELTESDMEIWEKLKEWQRSRDRDAALQGLAKYKSAFGDRKSETRERFLYYIVNKVQALIL